MRNEKQTNKGSKKMGNLMEFLSLHSVGTYIDTNNVTFPMNNDYSVDFDNPVHVGDISDEWLGKLSDEDKVKMLDWVRKNNKEVA